MIKLMFHKIVPFLQRVHQHEDIFNYKDKQQFGTLAVKRKKYCIKYKYITLIKYTTLI